MKLTPGSTALQNQITLDSTAACTPNCAGGCNLPKVPDLYACNLDQNCILTVPEVNYPNVPACIAQLGISLSYIVNLYCPSITPDATTATTTTSTTPNYFVPGIILAGKTVAVAVPAVAAAAFLLTPPLPLVTPQVSISESHFNDYRKKLACFLNFFKSIVKPSSFQILYSDALF